MLYHTVLDIHYRPTVLRFDNACTFQSFVTNYLLYKSIINGNHNFIYKLGILH